MRASMCMNFLSLATPQETAIGIGNVNAVFEGIIMPRVSLSAIEEIF